MMAGTFQAYDPEVVKQEIMALLLEKKDTWPVILASPSPWSYIRSMARNAVRSMDTECLNRDDHAFGLARYFRKRVAHCLRESPSFRTFERRTGRARSLWFTRSAHEGFSIKPIPAWATSELTLAEELIPARLDRIGDKEGILALAEAFIGGWEKREGSPLALSVNDLLGWILSVVDITEVYREDEAVPFADRPSYDDEGLPGFDVEQFGRSGAGDDPGIDRDKIVAGIASVLDEKEKRCLTLFLQGKKLHDIALEMDYKGPSGAKAVLDRAVGKIKLKLRALGYLDAGDLRSPSALGGPLIEYLMDVLKFPDLEPS
jgi:hypothetical protein